MPSWILYNDLGGHMFCRNICIFKNSTGEMQTST